MRKNNTTRRHLLLLVLMTLPLMMSAMLPVPSQAPKEKVYTIHSLSTGNIKINGTVAKIGQKLKPQDKVTFPDDKASMNVSIIVNGRPQIYIVSPEGSKATEKTLSAWLEGLLASSQSLSTESSAFEFSLGNTLMIETPDWVTGKDAAYIKVYIGDEALETKLMVDPNGNIYLDRGIYKMYDPCTVTADIYIKKDKNQEINYLYRDVQIIPVK